MKKNAKLLTSSLLVIALLSGVAMGQTEILLNGNFESWDNATTPTGWSHIENVNQEATTIHGGTYSAKHTGGTKDLGQTVSATPGNSYTITLWCKVEAGDNSDARLWALWKNDGTTVGSTIESPYFGVTDNSDWSTWSTSVTAPSGVNSLYFEVRTYSGATVYWDDLSIIEVAASSPLILLNPTTLNSFTYALGAGPSGEQSFTVTGSNLEDDISISVSDNYEVSSTSGGTFTSSLSLTESGGSVNATVFVRLEAELAVGTYNAETITASSTNADDKIVTCNGSVTAVEPSWDYIEAFANFPETGSSYATGTFTGVDGSTWNYIQARGDQNISAPTPCLGQSRTPNSEVYSGTITTGVGQIKFDYMQAFSSNCNFEVFINATSLGTFTTTSEQGITKHSAILDANISGDAVIKFTQIGNGGQVAIDNVKWTNFEAPLPITLASFTAKAKAGVVELAWETASETNNASFVIYRNNEVLATVEGAGTTSETQNYTYTDATVVPGVAYTYVLADVDYANTETKYEANAVTVTLGNDVVEADFVIGNAYPNPFNPTAIVPLTLSRDAVVNAKVYTLTGREVATLANGTMSAGSHELRITSDDMTTGLYLVRIEVENVLDVQKIAFVK